MPRKRSKHTVWWVGRAGKGEGRRETEWHRPCRIKGGKSFKDAAHKSVPVCMEMLTLNKDYWICP